MKFFLRLIFLAALGAMLPTNGFCQVRAVWLYDFDTWKGETDFGNRLYSASAMGFNQIYLGVLSHKLDEMGAGQYGSKMVEFVTQANTLNIAVHALTLQDPHFSLTYKHNDALVRIQDILNYNIAHPAAAFTGIHIDPEPHILLCGNDASHTCNAGNWESLPHNLWTTPPEETALAAVGGELENLSEPMKTTIKNRRAVIMGEFKTLLGLIRSEIDEHNLANDPDLIFSSTVGWWYNEKRTGAPGGNGYLPSGAEELTQYLDAIVPMVYSGGVGEDVDDIVERVEDEIRGDANGGGGPTIIGISHESLENFPGGVQAAIAGLEAEFDNDAAFGGVSVFQFDDLNSPYPLEYDVAPIANTSGLLFPENFEPESYFYNFIAPLRSELLCKNSHLGTTNTTFVSFTIPSTTYEDVAGLGSLFSTAVIAPGQRVWYIAEESITLLDGFQASTDAASDDFFLAEIKNEQPFCDDPTEYAADDFGYRLFTSIYGPRMTSSGGNISRPYDYHRGEDMVDMAVPTGPMPDIICMCDGEVETIFDQSDLPPGEDIEDTGEGQYVVVKCDASYGGGGLGNIYIAYRHLSEFAPGLTEGEEISKGDLIGKMGETGVTTSPHLHLSALKKTGSQYINLHPMRLFNNAFNKHLNLPVDEPPTSTEEAEMKKERVNLFLLDHSNGSANTEENYATFRIAVPRNKTAIRAILIRNGTYEQTADFEAISESRDNQPSCCNADPLCNANCLDNPNVGDLKLFTLPFVRAEFSTYNRYANVLNDLDDEVPDHPALTFPVLNQGVFTTPAYMLDIKAKGLPQFFDPFDFEIDVLDIWGNGVRGTLAPPPSPLIVPPVVEQQAQAATLEKISLLDENAAGDFQVKIYPNPTAGNELFVEMKGVETGAVEVAISSFSGQVLVLQKNQAGANGLQKIDIGLLAPGAYLVRVKTAGHTVTGKFIRQ